MKPMPEGNMKRIIVALVLLFAPVVGGAARAAIAVFPLKDIRAGMRGTGKTVFSGDRVEDFQVEILGVLENTGPKQSLILARLSGGPLEHTGVMQGMSGSPVYVDGKLIGAVALAFPFAKDPIAGIRPIEEMLNADAGAVAIRARLSNFADGFPAAVVTGFGDTRMTEVATPLSLSGFTAAAVEQFAPQLRRLGLEPRQGISTGGSPENRMGDRARLQPGSMISVELMTGDMSAGADGTVTAIDGDKIYAFGHRFLGVGPASIPFTRSEVMALLATVNTSFKISSARELMGVISQDRNTAVTGTLGKRAVMLPLDLDVKRAGRGPESYHMQIVNDPLLSPFLLQMALFSAIDSTERATGAATIAVNGAIEFEGRSQPVKIRNIYTADGGTAAQTALATAVSLSYLMQGGFDELKVKRISLQLEAFETKKEMNISQVYLSRKEGKPGEVIELTVQFDGPNGAGVTRSVPYQIPAGMGAGTLSFTVADGTQTTVQELRLIAGETPHSADQLIATVNRLRASDKAYVRVWRAQPSYQIGGEELPDPPPSIASVLGSAAGPLVNRNSRVAEMVIDAGEVLVSGSKTVQIEVKP